MSGSRNSRSLLLAALVVVAATGLCCLMAGERSSNPSLTGDEKERAACDSETS